MKNNFTEKDKGTVYVLGNSLFPKLLKIGRTARTAEIRCNELSHSTAIPEPFFLIYSINTDNPVLLEYLTHAYFECENKRLNPLKEFFMVSPQETITTINILNDFINNNTYLYSHNSVGLTPFDIQTEEDYIFDENNFVSPFSYCANFSFSQKCPQGLNPKTWGKLLNKIHR